MVTTWRLLPPGARISLSGQSGPVPIANGGHDDAEQAQARGSGRHIMAALNLSAAATRTAKTASRYDNSAHKTGIR